MEAGEKLVEIDEKLSKVDDTDVVMANVDCLIGLCKEAVEK